MPQIEGIVDEIVFRNEQNGWTVLSLRDGTKKISAVGVIPAVATGERLKIEGEWTEHPDYGRQMKISAAESVRPTTVSGIEKYLGSGAIKGLGPASARLIVQHFGEDALDVLDMNPDRLTEIDGIGPRRAHMIAESYTQQRELRQAMLALQGYGVTPALAMKIYRVFGENTVAVVRANPYLLAEKVQGIGFQTADGIALSMGVEPESPDRLRCGVVYAMNEAVAAEGHTYLPRGALVRKAAQMLGVAHDLVENAIDELKLTGGLRQRDIDGETALYTPSLFDAEGDVARRLSLLAHTFRADDAAKDVDGRIAQFEKKNKVRLGEEQREAVALAMAGPLTIITGGPGTGKTTGIKCVLSLLDKAGKIELCAPTGRAAKRMSEATGRPARTIHRLLEYAGDEEMFLKNEDDPVDADVVIADEMSMIDIFLMRALLRAIKPGARLIMVGDADQLPSVGAGNVLRDLIDSGVIPVKQLNEIFRQARESMIVVNAHRINRGEAPQCNAKTGDFFMERVQTASLARQSVLSLVSSRLPAYLGVPPAQIQVIAPMKKGDAGVWQLNRLLQEALNPRAKDKHDLTRGDTTFREGDKVMQTRNNYQLKWKKGGEESQGVFNGDIGIVTAIDPEERAITVAFDDDRVAIYADQDIEDLELAYCLTVHKSQGSEFDCVVMPLVSGPEMLFTRNLLYTAVTRARRLVVLVGRDQCVMRMIANNHVARRFSDLARRLKEAFSL